MSHRENIQFILLSLLLGFFIWLAVNFGERLPVDVTRFVELRGKNPAYTYEVNPPFVDVTLLVSRKLLRSKLLERVSVWADVSGLGEGVHRLRVRTYTPVPFLIEPVAVNPYFVEVVVKKPER
ncbi:MAG: hypothetical protein GXO04_03975 [Aquificae bacterium]|nr:hypothetical protein [Aquificota bacterium]